MERREILVGPPGAVDQFQFSRLGLGGTMALLAVAMAALTWEAVEQILAGEPLDYPIARVIVLLVGVISTVLSVRLIGRTVFQIRLYRTGKRARGRITAVESRDNVRWLNSYRFHDDQGNPREGRIHTRAPEWQVGDEGDVYYADAGSRWISPSVRELPPQPRPSLAKALAKMAGFIVVSSLLVSAGALLGMFGIGWFSDVLAHHGLLKGAALLIFGCVVLAVFAIPFVALLTLIVGPFIAAAWVLCQEAFAD